MKARSEIMNTQRWVVKVGSSLVTNGGNGLDIKAIHSWVEQMVELRAKNVELLLVSSGAVAEGVARLGWKKRPHAVHELQAAAAVGQMGLIQAYESAFQEFDLRTAQILLGHDDIGARDRYLNARAALNSLLELGVVPVVNENDTVVTDEIRLGDNDTLAALVANLVDADLLVILTDQEGVFNADPRLDAAAKRISSVRVDDESLLAAAGGSGLLGRGGMRTKITAARLAARSGAQTVIASGAQSKVLNRIWQGEDVGTWLFSDREPTTARKQWLAGMMRTRGVLTVDTGAKRVLCNDGKSLLPIGVVAVTGDFNRGDLVSCVDEQGQEVAKGLVNYSAVDARRVMGVSSAKIESVLGYLAEPELIHRDNLVTLL